MEEKRSDEWREALESGSSRRRVLGGLAASLMVPLTAGKALAKDRGKNKKQRGQVGSEAIIASPGPSSSAKQWRIELATGTTFNAGTRFSLFNTKNSSYVRYGSRTFGINLVWSSTASRSFSVARKTGTGPIKYGELVAIKENTSGGGYIKYASRDWGINLNWSSTPVYEWQIQGGTTGAVVPNRAIVTLNNITAPRPSFAPWCGKKGAAPVYGSRPFGINLVWNPIGFYMPSLSIPGVPDWANSLLNKAATIAATYLGIPVAQYKATQATLCALSRNGETGHVANEDPGLDRADDALLRQAAEDQRQAGDKAKGASGRGNHRNGRNHKNGKNNRNH